MARKKTGEQGVTVYLPEARYTALKHLSVDEKKSLSEILGGVIDAWWSVHPKRPKYEPENTAIPASEQLGSVTQSPPGKASKGAKRASKM